MLSKEDREIFHRLLDYLKVELRLRCVNGGPPDRNNASNNGLYFYSKRSGSLFLVNENDYPYTYVPNMGDEKNAARFLLESCIEFIEPQGYGVDSPISNPFFGCASLEAAAVKLDLLASTT